MENYNTKTDYIRRHRIAFSILLFSTFAITILAITIISNDETKAISIFNSVFPVLASWVGTVLAFYFGRENFESANKQVRELVNKVKTDKGQKSAIEIMRQLSESIYMKISSNMLNDTIKISDLQTYFSNSVSRLPIISSENEPLLIVHESRIISYITSFNGSKDDTLIKFLEVMGNEGYFFDFNRGFIILDITNTIHDAKLKLELIPSCKDIFITKNGSKNEPVLGWISDSRLMRSIKI